MFLHFREEKPRSSLQSASQHVSISVYSSFIIQSILRRSISAAIAFAVVVRCLVFKTQKLHSKTVT
ncbi:hypothetical protein FF021_21185 [Leptospira noguchii]|nr:hypothetical protein FF021_21185 [Leptospira noguchii]